MFEFGVLRLCSGSHNCAHNSVRAVPKSLSTARIKAFSECVAQITQSDDGNVVCVRRQPSSALNAR